MTFLVGTAIAKALAAVGLVAGLTANNLSISYINSSDESVSYDRVAASEWAYQHVKTPESFSGDDCTWFASQVLWAGGLPESKDWTGKSFDWSKQAARSHYPGPTRTAVQANQFVDYLVSHDLATKEQIEWSDNTAGGASLGDMIAYDWDDGANGTIDHISVVTKLEDGTGNPFISQHTPARKDRYWSWDPQGDDWIEKTHAHDSVKPRAYLIHIADSATVPESSNVG